MLLLFGVLVAVFAVPVSAKKLDGASLYVTFEKNMFMGMVQGQGLRPVLETGPYQHACDSNSWNSFSKEWSGIAGDMRRGIGYITMTFTVGDGTDLVDVAFDSIAFSATLHGTSPVVYKAFDLSSPSVVSFSVDGETVYENMSTEYEVWNSRFSIDQVSQIRTALPWSGKVSRTFGVTFFYNVNAWRGSIEDPWSLIRIMFRINNLTVNDVLTPIENIELKVGDISTKVKNIEEGIVDINGNLVDMKDQLSNPDSSIWSAGSSAIGEKVGELFTPSADDLTTATGALKDTMTDKLGGAYDAVEAVTGAGEQMRDKLQNPTPSQSITFPGISVPSAGMVEGFTILPSMEVTLPPKLTAVLQPVAGAIVCVLVGMYTLSSLKDMVVCFMSSMSYAEYVHRDKGGGSA